MVGNVIQKDVKQSFLETAEPSVDDLSDIELDTAASYDHYGGHYKEPGEYHGRQHSQPHSQSQSYNDDL